MWNQFFLLWYQTSTGVCIMTVTITWISLPHPQDIQYKTTSQWLWIISTLQPYETWCPPFDSSGQDSLTAWVDMTCDSMFYNHNCTSSTVIAPALFRFSQWGFSKYSLLPFEENAIIPKCISIFSLPSKQVLSSSFCLMFPLSKQCRIYR